MRRGPTVSLLDQVLANASNALMVLAVAGTSTPTQFGTFTIAYASLIFVVGLERSLLATPISLASGATALVRDEAAKAVGLLLLSAPVTVSLVFLGSGVLSGSAGPPTIGLAVATPIVLAQDSLRYAAVALKRPQAAFWSDLVWFAAAGIAFAGQILVGFGSTIVILAWVLGGVASLFVVSFLLRIRPRLTALGAWLRDSRELRYRLTVGAAAMSASVPIALAAFSALGGTAAVAAIGGASQLMAPVNTITAFIGLVLVAEMTGAARDTRLRVARLAAGGLAMASLVWASLLLVMPVQWGTVLLGDTWSSTRDILPLVGIQYAISGIAFAATLFLTSGNEARAVMFTGLCVAAGRLMLVTGAGLMGVTAWYLVSAEALTMVVWLVACLAFVSMTHVAEGEERD